MSHKFSNQSSNQAFQILAYSWLSYMTSFHLHWNWAVETPITKTKTKAGCYIVDYSHSCLSRHIKAWIDLCRCWINNVSNSAANQKPRSCGLAAMSVGSSQVVSWRFIWQTTWTEMSFVSVPWWRYALLIRLSTLAQLIGETLLR